jgi:hypothetical protein
MLTTHQARSLVGLNRLLQRDELKNQERRRSTLVVSVPSLHRTAGARTGNKQSKKGQKYKTKKTPDTDWAAGLRES